MSQRPFSLSPDPAFLYHSRRHVTALSMLEYGLISEAPIVLVTGEIGTGKTTLIRHLLNKLDASIVVGLISNTHKTFGSLMEWVCLAFGLNFEGRHPAALWDELTRFLIGEFAKGKRALLIVDEAQNMNEDVLEELRVLSNINSDGNLALQIFIVGQPELRETLRKKSLDQFTQRIVVDFHLTALTVKETRQYIQHRLGVAGSNRSIFQSDAILAIHQVTEGIPRLINALCEQALVYAFADGRTRVTAKVIGEVVTEKQTLGLFGGHKNHYDADTGSSGLALARQDK